MSMAGLRVWPAPTDSAGEIIIRLGEYLFVQREMNDALPHLRRRTSHSAKIVRACQKARPIAAVLWPMAPSPMMPRSRRIDRADRVGEEARNCSRLVPHAGFHILAVSQQIARRNARIMAKGVFGNRVHGVVADVGHGDRRVVAFAVRDVHHVIAGGCDGDHFQLRQLLATSPRAAALC